LALLTRKGHLGHNQRGRLKPTPGRRTSAVGGEGKAADGDWAAAFLLARRVGYRPGRQRAPPVGDRDEAIRTRILDTDRLAKTGQRRPTAIGLLEDEPR